MIHGIANYVGGMLIAAFALVLGTASAFAQTDTIISIGSLASDILVPLLTAFATVIAAFIVGIVYRFLKGAGIAIDETYRQRLQELVINGINWGAQQLGDSVRGKGEVDVKSMLLVNVLEYVRTHGTELFSKWGVSPNTPAFEQAIEARMTRALVDPAVPTPAAVTPAEGIKVA